jgi:hypothetical protein
LTTFPREKMTSIPAVIAFACLAAAPLAAATSQAHASGLAQNELATDSSFGGRALLRDRRKREEKARLRRNRAGSRRKRSATLSQNIVADEPKQKPAQEKAGVAAARNFDEETVPEDEPHVIAEDDTSQDSEQPADGPAEEEPKPQPAKTGQMVGGKFTGHGTHFDGMGTPFGGCGVPPEKAKDDAGTPLPYVALNTNSVFDGGSNCGRWVEIILGENCEGAGNTAYSICDGGRWVPDGRTGEKIFGYVMDSCADDNFWCQDDPYHLDISKPYLTGMDLTGNAWNGRKVSWAYMNGAPPGCAPLPQHASAPQQLCMHVPEACCVTSCCLQVVNGQPQIHVEGREQVGLMGHPHHLQHRQWHCQG